MSLAPGSRLGPYEVTAKLGEGGMGVVWKAKDFHLEREVALKVLPEGVIADPERVVRFEREAKLLASLNHPNIAQIYGLEVAGDTRALVMELVEGPTLAERLEDGSLPLEESLSIARQIAAALEEAHERGIIHRDLKPQNIKASIEGRVKVLDFGLAKAMDPVGSSAASPADLAQSPTVTFGATREGVILGTAAYMSPEQARGAAVDKRADIWAFGVVLYEMLAGERLFTGESLVDVLGAVMRQAMELDRLPATTPRRLRELVRRCLERDPKRRLRDVGDARIVLEELVAGGGAEEERAGSVARLAASSVGRRLGLAAAAAAVLAGAVALGWSLRGAAATPAKPSFRFQKLTFLPGAEWAPELSADGRTLFFAAGDASESALYSVPVGGKTPTLLTPDAIAFHDSPRLSPDGSRLAFASSRDGGGLFLMGVNGESVRKLAEVGSDPAWSPDGRAIAFSTEELFLPYHGIDGGRLGVIDVASGSRRLLEAGDAHQPAWSPSGSRIAYWGLFETRTSNREIATIGIDGGAPLAVASDPAVDWNPVWSEDGRHLYFLSDRGGAMNLWRVAIDEASGRQLAAPESVPLPADEVIYLARSGKRWVYAAYSSRSQIQRLEFDPERSALVGVPRPVLSTTRTVRTVEPSPDGKRLAFTTMRPQEDLYVVAAEGGTPTQLTDDPEFDRFASWAPGGEEIVFDSDRGEGYQQWGIRPDGSGLRALTRTTEDPGWSPVLSPRADRLVATLPQGIIIFDASGPAPWQRFERIPPPVAVPGANFSAAAWSPLGDKLAGSVYGANEPRRVAVLDLETKSYRLFDPPSRPVGWYPDGRRLLVDYRGELAILDLATWTASPVTNSPELRGRVSASRDLRTIVTLEDDQQADVWLAEELP
ncbi:MAG TPA: protein kinase [Thermoanaerobaculia bacterium]|nr:protein kinase [Thermoanaerobaculia bacterium]